ncbi:MAG: hypothetical protein KGH71_04045 [Candidatus Micrarchaeota archaeon]|nr:hypothetical protein [Candidatus Micrarchaeota archaeon]
MFENKLVRDAKKVSELGIKIDSGISSGVKARYALLSVLVYTLDGARRLSGEDTAAQIGVMAEFLGKEYGRLDPQSEQAKSIKSVIDALDLVDPQRLRSQAEEFISASDAISNLKKLHSERERRARGSQTAQMLVRSANASEYTEADVRLNRLMAPILTLLSGVGSAIRLGSEKGEKREILTEMTREFTESIELFKSEARG